jgi:exodeoxyribonuclease III
MYCNIHRGAVFENQLSFLSHSELRNRFMSATASIVTWNVNSLRARREHVEAFLKEEQPDVLLLQELKLEEAAFPYDMAEEYGYNAAVLGQKTYNGVAILSRTPIEDVETPALIEGDTQARYIEAVTSVHGVVMRVVSVYVPNGQEVGSEKFAYKLAYLDALRTRLTALLAYQEVLVVGGDYNVAPSADDVWDASALDGTVCFHPEERRRWYALTHLGLYDAYRTLHPQGNAASWWDYRGAGFERGHGMRIDHLLLSPEATDRLTGCDILTDVRAKDKPSDHAPIRVTLRANP